MTKQQPTATLVWARELYARAVQEDPAVKHGPDDGAFYLMRITPPVHSVPCHTDRLSRILLLGTASCFEYLEPMVPTLATKNGVSEPYFVEYGCQMGLPFWQNFFGNPDFLGTPEANHLPELIIMSGLMRFYDGDAGHVGGDPEAILQAADRWGIPVEFHEPPKRH